VDPRAANNLVDSARRRRLAREILTVGQVKVLCEVSARTVQKWCDTGLLPHFRIPGSLDRRIRKTDLIAFASQHNMPLNWRALAAAGEPES
jgi:hypothetical protein